VCRQLVEVSDAEPAVLALLLRTVPRALPHQIVCERTSGTCRRPLWQTCQVQPKIVVDELGASYERAQRND
jgi:hypothetical protein